MTSDEALDIVAARLIALTLDGDDEELGEPFMFTDQVWSRVVRRVQALTSDLEIAIGTLQEA